MRTEELEPEEIGATTAPEDEARWLPELPPAYRGEEVIRGIVVDERGQPVPDAQVMCRPFRWVPFGESHFDALTRRTDSRGSFTFESFPAAPIYEIAVLSEQGYAIDRYPQRRATVAPLQIRTTPVYYERIGFHDEAGRPHDVSQVHLRPVGHYTITVRWAHTAAPLHGHPIRIEVDEGWQKHDAR